MVSMLVTGYRSPPLLLVGCYTESGRLVTADVASCGDQCPRGTGSRERRQDKWRDNLGGSRWDTLGEAVPGFPNLCAAYLEVPKMDTSDSGCCSC